MEKYLVTNKTIALLKMRKKTIIINVENIEVINKSIKYILEYNCNYYGSSLEGRIKSAKDILNVKYKVPIIIDENNNIFLITISSIRNDINLYLVTNKILNYEIINEKLVIYSLNNIKITVNLSKNNLENSLLKVFQLNNILKWRKNRNLL